MENYVFIIKPMLETFLKSPTKENVIELKHTIENIEFNQIRNLETYIIAPLVLKLDDLPGLKSSDLKCEIINCIKITTAKTKIKNLNQLKTTLIIMLKQIHDFNSGLLYEHLSEEIKLAVLSCLFETFRSTNSEVLELFYIKQNSNIIGKIASTCVDVLQNDKYKKLKISAIQCLQSLFYVHNEADLNDIVLRDQVANSTFLFLPKIVAVLTEVADGEEKIGQSLIILSIQTLGRILHIIYEDKIQTETKQYSSNDFLQLVTRNMDDFKLNENEEHSTIGSNIKNKTLDERIKIIQELIRNDKWFAVTSKKLKPIFLRLQILQSNSNEKVRKEYTIFVVNLFKKCLINLNENGDIFLESIIALSQDNDSEIRELCENTLQDYQKNEKLSIKWESLFKQHMIKLPRIITRNDDAQQITEFLFLKGFFKHIPKQTLFTLFSFKYNVERFVNTIVEALTLNYSRDLLNEEYFIRSSSENSYNFGHLPWRKFKNISSLKAISLLQNTCEHIGASSINSIVFNFLIDFLHENQQLSNEIFLFVTFLLIGNSEIKENSDNSIEIFLSELNNEKHWHLALLPDDANQVIKEPYSSWYVDRTPGLYESGYEVRVTDVDHSFDLNINSKANIVSNFDAEFNVLHTCIVLDSIGNCATVTKEDFRKYIFNFLHRILHKSNSTNLIVQKAGFFALNSIKSCLRYENIYHLVNDYSDYLSYHISSSLKRIELNGMGIGILAVVMQYSSLHSFNYLDNIMKTLLEELAKENISASSILSFLKVFNIFFGKVQKWVNSLKEDLNSNAQTQDLNNMENDLLTTLKNILKKPIHDSHFVEEDFKSCESNMKEEDSENINCNKNEEINIDEKTSIYPKYVYTTLDILKNILKFISSKEQMHKIIALECFISGLPILKDFEDELLPLVHLLWYPYSERFKESNPIVLNRCFSLLEILVDCSKNFLQRRILKDIIPFLNEFLRKSLQNSFKNKNLTSTQEHKLQIKLLKSYGKILTDMEIQHENLEEITDIVILYLNKNQPTILQECAVLYLVHISKYNKPLLFMKLMYYKDNDSLKDNISTILSNIGLQKYNYVVT